ncbi:MAG: hypothetical protein KKA84_12060 [Bacteroidetes bacterium]|nr:hypothetical protein [Bacteroidota bacterium]
MAEKKAGIFETIYNATDELRKSMKAPLVKNKLKRRLESAWDDAENKKIDATAKIQDIREDLSNYDINKILDNKDTVVRLGELQVGIAAEFLELFGETMAR